MQILNIRKRSDVYTYGTRSTILQVMRMPKGTLKILVEGISRARIIKTEETDEFLSVEIEDLPTTGFDNEIELEALWRQLKSLYNTYGQLNTKIPADLLNGVKNHEDMDIIADTLAVHINISFDERQEIIRIGDLKERLTKLCAFLQREIDILETEERIQRQYSKTG